MGVTTKVRPRPEPRGAFYWLYRAFLGLAFALMFGGLVGLWSVFVGMLLGELAVMAFVVLFFTDMCLRIRQAQRMDTYDDDPWQDDWDDLD